MIPKFITLKYGKDRYKVNINFIVYYGRSDGSETRMTLLNKETIYVDDTPREIDEMIEAIS